MRSPAACPARSSRTASAPPSTSPPRPPRKDRRTRIAFARNGCYAAAPVSTPSQHLTDAEEEKLAHDLYAAFAGRYSATVFDNIAAAETRHLGAVRTLLARYGLADPTTGKAAGAFATPAIQASYDRLLAQGKTSQDAALRAGQAVERDDIAALTTALTG